VAAQRRAFEQEHCGDHYALILFATVGMVTLAMGMDLVTLFIGLELMARAEAA